MRFDDFYANVRAKYPNTSLDEVREAYSTKFDRDPVFESAPPRDQFRLNVANNYPDLTDDEIDEKYDEIYGDSWLGEAKRGLQRGLGSLASTVGRGIQALQEELPSEARGLPMIGPLKAAADALPSGEMVSNYWQDKIKTVPKSAAAQGDVLERPGETLSNPLWWAAGLPEVATSQLPIIAAAGLGGPVGAGLVGGAMEGLSTYGEAKDAGLENPLLRGAGMGAAAAALNAIPFAKGLGGGVTGLLGRMGAEGLTEGAEEYPGTYLETEASKWGDAATLTEAHRRAANVAPLAAVSGGLNSIGMRGGPQESSDLMDVTRDLMGDSALPAEAPVARPAWVEELATKGEAPYLPQPGVKKTVLPKSEQKRAAVESALAPVYQNWKGGPKVNVVGSFRDLPKDIQERFDDSINGAYDGRENVYLIADKYKSPDEASRVLYHESLGHYSIEQIIPDIDTFAADVARLAPQDPVLSRYWADVTENPGYAKEEPLVQALETVAKYAEEFPNTKHPMVERIYSRLREFGRRLGIKTNLNRADLNLALRKAMRNLERGTHQPTARTPDGGMKAQRVWHGSPHDHEGFDNAKIGTGEGARTYGYGHYFAGAKEVAEHYRKKLTPSGRYLIDGAPPAGRDQEIAAQMIGLWGSDRIGRIEAELRRDKGIKKDRRERILAEANRIVDSGAAVEKDKGRLYEVEIPDDGDYLLWDKPLSEQSETVQRAVAKAADAAGVDPKSLLKMRGEGVYLSLASTYAQFGKNEGMEFASSDLRQAGIPGIKYLDGVSRDKGEGHHNYVVFDDSDTKIVSKASRPTDYRGNHRAPGPDGAAPAHDLAQIYPDDVYGPNGLRYYGTGDDALDRESYSVLMAVRGKPNAKVTIYRAVPSAPSPQKQAAKLEKQLAAYLRRGALPEGVSAKQAAKWYEDTREEVNRLEASGPAEKERYPITPGDWVTLSRAYAKQHGESTLNGQYRIEKKVVRASEIYTNGDSWNEFGYQPREDGAKASRAPYPAKVETFDDRALQSVVRAAEFSPDVLNAYVAIAKGQTDRIETQRRGVQSWDQTAKNAAATLASEMGFKHVASLTSAAPGTAANPEALVILAGAIHEATERVESAAMSVTSDRSPANLATLKAALDRLAYLQAPWMGMRAEAGRALNILRKVAPIASNVNALVDAYIHNPEALEATAKTIVDQKVQNERDNPAAPVEREIVAVESESAQLQQEMSELRELMSQLRSEAAQARQESAAEPAAVDSGLADLESQNREATKQRTAAAATVKRIEREIAELRKKQADILSLESQAEAAAQDRAGDAAFLAENRQRLKELKARNAKEKARIDAGLKSLQEQQQVALDAQMRLDQAAKDLEAKRAEMLERKRAVSKGESQTKAKLKRVEEQLRKVEQREKDLLKRQAELAAKRGELQQRRDALRRATPKRRTTASIVREEYTPTLGDKFLEYYYNSILSGPATHLVNIFGNSAFQVTEEIAKQVGLRATGQSKAATARLNAITLGIQTGLRNAKNAFATELPQLDQQTKMEIDPTLRAAISGTKGKVIRLPGRALQAEDEFFKGVSYTMELAQLATQAAQGDMTKAREIMANPPQEMQQEAVLAARRTTFTSKVGPSARSLMTFLNKVKPAKLIIPFVQTPVNILKRAMDYSPFGLAGIPFDTEIGNDLKGNNGPQKQAVAISRQVLGGGVALMLWQLAAAGLVTGGGPPDPQERTLWRQRDGRDVYSVKIGDKWVSYLRFDPLAIPMGVMADLYEAVGMLGERDAEDIALTVMNSLVNNVANKTWLSGVSGFAEAINDPQRYGEGFLGMLASGIAVPNIVGQVTNYNDQWVRQARTVLDRVRSRIPGERQELARKVGISGQDIENNGVTALGIPTPLRATDATEVDPLADAMLRLGVIKSAPSRRFMSVELTDQEHSDWVKQVQQVRWKNLTPIVQSPQFQQLPPIVQAAQLEKLWTKFGSNEYARTMFLMQHPEVLDRIRKTRKKAG